MVNISIFLLLCVCEKGFRELKESLFDCSISCADITKEEKPDLHAVQVKVWSVSFDIFHVSFEKLFTVFAFQNNLFSDCYYVVYSFNIQI